MGGWREAIITFGQVVNLWEETLSIVLLKHHMHRAVSSLAQQGPSWIFSPPAPHSTRQKSRGSGCHHSQDPAASGTSTTRTGCRKYGQRESHLGENEAGRNTEWEKLEADKLQMRDQCWGWDMGAMPEDSGTVLATEKQGGSGWKSHHAMAKSLKVTEDRDRSTKCRAWCWCNEHRRNNGMGLAQGSTGRNPRRSHTQGQGVQWEHFSAGTEMEPEVPPSTKHVVFLKGSNLSWTVHTHRHLHIFLFFLLQ